MPAGYLNLLKAKIGLSGQRATPLAKFLMSVRCSDRSPRLFGDLVRCHRCTAASKTIALQKRRNRMPPPRTRRCDSASGPMESHSSCLRSWQVFVAFVLSLDQQGISVETSCHESQAKRRLQMQRHTPVPGLRSPCLTLFRQVPGELRRPRTN